MFIEHPPELSGERLRHAEAILEVLGDGFWHTRGELARATGLSRDAVTSILDRIDGIGESDSGHWFVLYAKARRSNAPDGT